MNTAIANAEASHSSKDVAALKTMAASLSKEAAAAKAPADASRMRALAEIMKGRAAH